MAAFDGARRAAVLQDMFAALGGSPSDLLPFEEVKERLRLEHFVDRGVQEVPLEAIAGSLGRSRDFTRDFLPRDEALRDRWEEIYSLAKSFRGFPPVELYQVGETYFVVDGHHRISVARANDAPTIEARVREFLTPVPLDPDASLEDVMTRSGLADFLDATGLSPEDDEDFLTTNVGGYETLLEHIAVHRYYLGLEHGRCFGWEEAVASWRDLYYRPVVQRLRESGVLDEFPGRTATDLYLAVMAHLAELKKRYTAHAVAPRRAADHFVALHRSMTASPWDRLRIWWQRLLGRLGTRHAGSSASDSAEV